MMPSQDVDNDCYWHAVRDVFGVPSHIPDLNQFHDVTDNGVLAQWVRAQFGREVHRAEVNRVKTLFLFYLRSEAERHRHEFLPTRGLQDWLADTMSGPVERVAIATGGWGHTARFKLHISGLAHFGLPLASSDDATHRTGIMIAALSRLSGAPMNNPRGVTYIGDGPWDARAAKLLGWGFIGIAKGHRAALLQASGARRVYADFNQLRGDRITQSRP